MVRFESPVERAIREAQERGAFDNLPGAGKPLRDLGNTSDPDWWIKGFVQREQLDMGSVLPPTLALRKEAEGFPQSLLELGSEESVRAVLEDFNRRVKLDRLRPAMGRLPAPIARTVDVDELVDQWRQLKAAQRRATQREQAASRSGATSRGHAPRTRVGRWMHRFGVWAGMAE